MQKNGVEKMIRKTICLLLLSCFIVLACDKGLAPPEIDPISSEFPVMPLGGNPVGNWVPRPEDPVELTMIDDSQIPALVDSFIFDTELKGIFNFELANVCSVDAVLTLNPLVYLQGSTEPIPFTFPDTIRGSGAYYLIENNILQTPIESTNFNLDTLGFTSGLNSLELISLPNVFSYLGIIDIPIYFIFHLTRADQNPLQKGAGTDEYHRQH